MSIWLTTFANAPFEKSRRRLCASALAHGADRLLTYGMADLKRDPYFHAHQDLFAYKLRIGNCLWKPLFIKRSLERIPEGETLFYCDSGVEVIDSIKPLETIVQSNVGIVPFVVHELAIGYWTKRDCLVLLDCDSPEYYKLDQTNAAFILFRKCPAAVAFVDEWLAACTDKRTLTDDPNVMGKDDLPLFIAHRHDQAILSLLLRKKKIEHYRDPSQYGNHHLERPHYLDEANWPWRNSPYPTLFNHHRIRSTTLRQVPGAAMRYFIREARARRLARRLFPAKELRPFVEMNRKTLAAVPRWVDESTYARSLVNYSVSLQTRPLIDRPLDRQITFSDAIVYLSTFLAKPVTYLELGVAYGKNFAQVLHGVKNASLTARGFEDINPTLEKMLVRREVTRIPDPTPSQRGQPILVTDYTFPANHNTVRHIAGDPTHDASWQPMSGMKFNLIFVNLHERLHRQLFLHEMLRELDLIDGEEFIMVWDNLTVMMEIAFKRIAEDLRHRHGPMLVASVPMRGVLGQHEPLHRVGFIVKSPKYP